MEIMFSGSPAGAITAKVTIIDTGIDTATIIEVRKLRRKKSSTKKVKKTACTAVLPRLDMERVIKVDVS